MRLSRAARVQRVVGLVLAAAFAVAAVAAGLAARSTGVPVVPPAGSPGRATPSASSPVEPSPSTPASQQTTSPNGPTGPGNGPPSVRMRVTPDVSGGFEVVEQLVLPQPMSILSIAPGTTSAVTALARATPAIVGLQGSADGAPVRVPWTLPLREPRSLALPQPSRIVVLRYRLEGATARSTPAPPGRVLALLRPVTAASLGELQVVIEVAGQRVRNLVCLQLPAAQQLCGRRGVDGWSTSSMPASRSFVLAQLDLGEPGG